MDLRSPLLLLFRRVIPKERVAASNHVFDGLMIFTRPQSGNDFECGRVEARLCGSHPSGYDHISSRADSFGCMHAVM